MPDLLLEVGTEEMPAGAVAQALDQLRTAVEEGLAASRLPVHSVRTYGTPRRLILFAEGVPQRQPDQERDVRGPARSVAFDPKGHPTPAAIGFARKQGVPVQALQVVRIGDAEYMQARIAEAGRPASEVVGAIIEGAIKQLGFPKMMRWGDQSRGGMRFVRPIRWILCLLDDEIVSLEVAGVRSGRETRGHRFLSPAAFEVGEPRDIFHMLYQAGVMVDPDERRRAIVAQANALARDVSGAVPWDDSLLEENVWLVEWPTALRGDFDADYLQLPRPVLVTAMKKHQRYFPVEAADGRLLPHFIAIRNGGDAHLDVVREGNQRVLTARFADATYFYKQDLESSLDAMAEGLSRLVFQDRLGTLAQKRDRLRALTAVLADRLGLDAPAKARAVRAADLCKADLVSRMVVELPVLQGVMGREYALTAGEDAEVADAIAEHYRPRSAVDASPGSDLGKLLAVADRLDTLVGYIGVGILPSGSSDPYGLRRAAHGVLQILATEPEMPELADMQALAADTYRQVNGLAFPLDPLLRDAGALFDQRLTAYLEERGVRYDLIDATLGGRSVYPTLVYATLRRGEALQGLAGDPDFVPTTQAAARTANILRSAGYAAPDTPTDDRATPARPNPRSVEAVVGVLERGAGNVDPARLDEPSEVGLFDAARAVMPEVARCIVDHDYGSLYRVLDRLRQPVNTFFDDVMVMVEDEAIRANRLALLAFVDTLYKTLADFTRVVVA